MFAEFIKIIVTLLILSGALYSIFSLLCSVEFFREKRQGGQGTPALPVSIIKPLKGSDPELRENLESFCSQDYSDYEILLGFTDPNDDAITLAKEITASRRDCDIRTVINQSDQGANPKVSNLTGLVRAARYPLVAISDGDMRVTPSYLKTIVKEYQSGEKVGLVTSLYTIPNPASLGAALESLSIALDFIPSVLVARRLEGVTFGLGASMLLSKEALEEIGGLSSIADYLADDYQIGNRLWKKGYAIVLSDYVVEDVVGRMSLADYLTHQIRWARTYRACRPKGFLGFGITHMLPYSVLLLVLQGPTVFSLSILCGVLVLRLSIATVLYRKAIRTKKWLRWLLLIPVKDLLSFGIWLRSFSGRKVFWRGRYFKITKGGRIKEE
jgi:ceramide glucosyltransferase